MSSFKNLINKKKLRKIRTNYAKRRTLECIKSPHRIYSAALLGDSLEVICKDFERVAYIGDYPEIFFENFKNGKNSIILQFRYEFRRDIYSRQ